VKTKYVIEFMPLVFLFGYKSLRIRLGGTEGSRMLKHPIGGTEGFKNYDTRF